MISYQQVASKSLKTKVLEKNPSVLPYLPETNWFDPAKLREMLDLHRSVFIKPDRGGGGGGVILVNKLSNDKVECSTLYKKEIISTDDLIEWVEKRLKSTKRYIMQQGISLAKVKSHPFDLRVHLQKIGKNWEISGVCAKVTASDKIVTNFCKGGQPNDASKTILEISDFDRQKAKKVLVELYNLSKEIAKTLNSRFTGLKELGVDVGIDTDRHIWIFEVNTRPGFKMFSRLEDLSMYHRIRKNRVQWIKRR